MRGRSARGISLEHHTIDITGDHCPLTFVRVKIALAPLRSGERLEVILREGEPLENVPRAAEGEGHRIVERAGLGRGLHRIVIEKGKGNEESK